MKRCNRCSSNLPLESFYKNKRSPDGRCIYCKSCDKARVKEYQERCSDKVASYEEKRSKCEKRLSYRKNYNRSENAKISQENWKINNPKRWWAIKEVKKAKERGDLIKQPCEICGSKENIHAHHCDYNKPLDVMWLCPKHHKEWHSENEPIL